MSHRWDCPSDYEARSRARRDAEQDSHYGYSSHRRPYEDCDHSNETYRREYLREQESRDEEARQQRASERRRNEREKEEAYWRECQEQEYQRAMDEQCAAAMQEHQRQPTEGCSPSETP